MTTRKSYSRSINHLIAQIERENDDVSIGEVFAQIEKEESFMIKNQLKDY